MKNDRHSSMISNSNYASFIYTKVVFCHYKNLYTHICMYIYIYIFVSCKKKSTEVQDSNMNTNVEHTGARNAPEPGDSLQQW